MTFPQDPRVDPELESAIESELASRPMASETFRNSLRGKFVSGALDPSAPDVETQPKAPAKAKPLSSARSASEVRRRRAQSSKAAKSARTNQLRWILAAAAVLILSTLGWWFQGRRGSPEASRWRVLAAATEQWSPAELAVGGQWTTQESAAVLRLDSQLVIELGPNSNVRLLELYDAVGTGQTRLELLAGSLHVATSKAFAPRRLSVLAPHSEIDVVGTEFGIDIIPDVATCICCNEGKINVRSPQGSAHTLAAGEMAWCTWDDNMPMYAPAKREHLVPIEALRRWCK